jgi:hypothetical protein
LGLTDLGAMTDQQLPIKALRFDGALPTLASTRTGSFPLVKTLAFAFAEKRLPDSARAFLEFVRSPEGERSLRARGCLQATEGSPMSAGVGAGRDDGGSSERTPPGKLAGGGAFRTQVTPTYARQ